MDLRRSHALFAGQIYTVSLLGSDTVYLPLPHFSPFDMRNDHRHVTLTAVFRLSARTAVIWFPWFSVRFSNFPKIVSLFPSWFFLSLPFLCSLSPFSFSCVLDHLPCLVLMSPLSPSCCVFFVFLLDWCVRCSAVPCGLFSFFE